MYLEMNDGFNLMYAKKMGTPMSILLKSRIEVLEFIIENEDNIDFLSINDVVIDLPKLINDNVLLGRYIKMKKINENS